MSLRSMPSTAAAWRGSPAVRPPATRTNPTWIRSPPPRVAMAGALQAVEVVPVAREPSRTTEESPLTRGACSLRVRRQSRRFRWILRAADRIANRASSGWPQPVRVGQVRITHGQVHLRASRSHLQDERLRWRALGSCSVLATEHDATTRSPSGKRQRLGATPSRSYATTASISISTCFAAL